MKKQLAFVLGGGGSRGALQAGALKAVLEADIIPHLLVGTSTGALNCALLAVHGMGLDGVETLLKAWHDAKSAELLPADFLWLAVRELFEKPSGSETPRLRDFLIKHGVHPEITFGNLRQVRLISVAADLNTGSTIVYGTEPHETVLEGVLASSALPPWSQPIEKDGLALIDGSLVSSLPIEPAIGQGATEIIAFNLSDPRQTEIANHSTSAFFSKVVYTLEQRQMEMELALAAALDVPVRMLNLCGVEPVPIWDFRSTEELIAHGYKTARYQISRWKSDKNFFKISVSKQKG